MRRPPETSKLLLDALKRKVELLDRQAMYIVAEYNLIDATYERMLEEKDPFRDLLRELKNDEHEAVRRQRRRCQAMITEIEDNL